jgi:regulator of protease activity HflC (stomatin/prohibitin superfamily)
MVMLMSHNQLTLAEELIATLRQQLTAERQRRVAAEEARETAVTERANLRSSLTLTKAGAIQ